MPVDEPLTFIPDEELPENDPHHRSRYHNFAMALRGNMGQWALYPGKVKNPSSAAQRINNDRFGTLPCTDFEAKVIRGQVYVRYWPMEMRPGQQQRHHHVPPPPSHSTDTWAVLLFQRVGPERAETLYKMLSRVLHPDMPLGSEILQKELNAAMDQVRS